MPSQDTWAPISGLKQATYKARRRDWITTPNFGSLPKDQKPVNHYRDTRFDISQKYSAGYFYWHQSTPGSKIQYEAPQYKWTGAQLENAWYNFVTQSRHQNLWPGQTNALLTSCLVEIADAKVNIGVALAEARKTSDMILDTARRIDRAYRAFRRGRFREVARLLQINPKQVHKTWLGYKYGWMPLLMDVKNAAEFFAQQHVGKPPRFTVRKKFKGEKSFSYSTPYAAWGSTTVNSAYAQTLTVKNEVIYKFWLEITNSNYAALQQLGVTNPALVAWELVPYSFVFDWFISVGDWLTALSALDGVTLRRGMFSAKSESTYTYSQPATLSLQAGYWYSAPELSYSVHITDYSREATSIDVSNLYPPRRDVFGFQKLVTSLALIRARS